jgi:hypothetical protein
MHQEQEVVIEVLLTAPPPQQNPATEGVTQIRQTRV